MTIVLITCAGSGVGQSVLDSLSLSGNYKMIGCDLKKNVYAFNLCHQFYVAPNIYSPDYIDFILDICQKENIDVIVPGHDHELLLFSRNIQLFEDIGVEVIVSLPDIIEISRDKYKWYKYFKEHGCSIVPTIMVSEFKDNPDESFFPAIVKPLGGSASQGVKIINSFNELIETNDDDIIQPYLFPAKDDANYNIILNAIKSRKFVQMSEISVQLVFSKNSELSGIFISKNTLKSGVPMFVDPIDPDEFEYIEEIEKFANVLFEKKVKGPVNLQGRIMEKGFVFFEMNMRFTGITGNRAKLGFNEVTFLVNNFMGLSGKLNGYASNKLGVRQVACSTISRLKNPNQTKRTYAILGAGGFIGSNFTHELIKTNTYKEIYLICRDESFEKYSLMYESFPNVKIHKETDIAVESSYCKSDVFLNFASARVNEKDVKIFDSILFQYRQAQKVYNSNIPLIVNISSQSLYDQSSDIVKDEQTPLNIDNLYSFQKYIAEEFFNSIHLNSPAVKVISLRFTRVIGSPYNLNKPSGFFAKVIESLYSDEYIDIPYPMNKINLIDIRDAVNSIFYIINSIEKEKLPSVMNIGCTNLSIKEYCDLVIKSLALYSKEKMIRYGDFTQVISSSMVNTDLSKSYNWLNKYTIEDTIKDIARHFYIQPLTD